MKDLVEALERLAVGLENHVDEFAELDSKAGDGDLGLTAGKIAGAIRTAVEEPGESAKQLVLRVGKEISKAAPSTFGTLYASGFLAAGLAIEDDKAALDNLQIGLRSALEKIGQRGKSEEGQRTLLDALGPASRAVDAASDVVSALAEAAEAAARGAEATKSMTPQHGRAGWIGERAKGIADAGATVIWRSLEALTR